MSATVIILILLSATVGIGCLLTGIWLWRALNWEVVDDDDLHERISPGAWSRRKWLRGLLKSKPPLLTYRRDRRGRFRRYRR